jgi:hypothetical protein
VNETFEKINPSIGIALRKKIEKALQEEAQKQLEAELAKKKEDEESGRTEHVTNLPLELLYKKKIEQRMREHMIAQGIIAQEGDMKPSLGAAQNLQADASGAQQLAVNNQTSSQGQT